VGDVVGVEIDTDEFDLRMQCGDEAEVQPLAAAELQIAARLARRAARAAAV
jgi:hypothetical protein